VVLAGFSLFNWLFANFISHTVAAIIVMPVVVSVGCELGGGDCQLGHFRLLALGSLYMNCSAMVRTFSLSFAVSLVLVPVHVFVFRYPGTICFPDAPAVAACDLIPERSVFRRHGTRARSAGHAGLD
jgi:hypothetical protein